MRLLFILLVAALVSGCAEMQQQFITRTCNYDGAYEYGANQAREHGPMEGGNLAAQCPVDVQGVVMQGYRAGYMSIENRPQPAAPLVVIGGPTAPPAPPQTCLERFGRRYCGYGCHEAFGQVRCARDPRHTCMDAYGKLYCGLNCREEYGKVVCDEYD